MPETHQFNDLAVYETGEAPRALKAGELGVSPEGILVGFPADFTFEDGSDESRRKDFKPVLLCAAVVWEPLLPDRRTHAT